MTSAAHAAIASALALVTWRALQQPWVDQFAEPTVVLALRWGLPLASAAASALAVIAGRAARDPTRLLVADAASWLGQLVVVFALALAPLDRDLVGVLYVTAVAARFAPAVVAAVRSEPALPFLFAVAVAVYASLAVWHQAGSLPLGDQVHYLLTADRLAHGSVDGTIDAALFHKLTTLEPNEADIATHLANAPTGPRTIQGYALPLLLLPGWLAGGRLGAEVVVALIAAAASAITALILRDTIVSPRLRGAVWAMAAFLPPALLMAFHVYPNVVGAAAIGAAYRFGFTAPTRRPLLAGALAGLTLFLNPRDGFVLLILLAAMAWSGRRALGRFALAAGAIAVIAIGSNAILYGLPLPYAGYVFGTAAAQELTHESTLTFRFWVGLPAMLFDRTFGLAGSAPWLFLALVGLTPALRSAPRALVPAAVAIGASFLALSFYRYWEGGYAPANRYVVDVLPLAAPFVACGLASARDRWMRATGWLLVGPSALAAFLAAAMPARALNDAYQQQLQELFDDILGLNPLGWLPSFQPTTPDWYVGAYLRLLPAVALAGLLVWYGVRARART